MSAPMHAMYQLTLTADELMLLEAFVEYGQGMLELLVVPDAEPRRAAAWARLKEWRVRVRRVPDHPAVWTAVARKLNVLIAARDGT